VDDQHSLEVSIVRHDVVFELLIATSNCDDKFAIDLVAVGSVRTDQVKAVLDVNDWNGHTKLVEVLGDSQVNLVVLLWRKLDRSLGKQLVALLVKLLLGDTEQVNVTESSLWLGEVIGWLAKVVLHLDRLLKGVGEHGAVVLPDFSWLFDQSFSLVLDSEKGLSLLLHQLSELVRLDLELELSQLLLPESLLLLLFDHLESLK